MTAVNRDFVRIAIVAAATNATDLASTDFISGEIKSYSKSGGEKDVESVPHFGGDVDKEKPRSQIELSFDVTPSMDDAAKWESIAYGTATVNGSVGYLSSVDPSEKAVFIESTEGSNKMTWAFDNCGVTMLDMEHDAEDNMTKTLNLKLSSQNDNGRANLAAFKLACSEFPNWSHLPNGS